MVFIESSNFTQKAVTMMSDERLAALQFEIKQNPEIGDLIKPNLCGLRKVRFGDGTKGKSGGFRVSYYWIVSDSITLLLDIYRKTEQENLMYKEMQQLCSIIKELRHDNV